VKIGPLRHKIRIEQIRELSDGMGGHDHVWDLFAESYAEIREGAGTEKWQAESLISTVSTDVIIRYLTGVTPDMRVSHGARHFDIVAVTDPSGRREMLRLQCREVRR
jgi:SPP1 family predicted phage head-tail adaptor